MATQLDPTFRPDREHPPGVLDRLDPKYQPVWAGRSVAERTALARYFLPHQSRQPVVKPTRPRVIKWYCPFASQHAFPSGHRYCINVYTGCAHACVYCYAAAYEPQRCSPKRDFKKLLDKDLADLERFDMPAAPVHLSNSTDACQPLERATGHAKYALERILAHRRRFTTVTLLTKNPLQLAEPGYLEPLQALCAPLNNEDRPGLIVEVSLAFWRDEARAFYEPGAPSVARRIEGIRALRAAGIPLVLRVDPLFPRSPLPEPAGRSLADFGLTEAQRPEDLQALVELAARLDLRRIVFSVLKIVPARSGSLAGSMQAMRAVYAACAAPARVPFRSGSWRFPTDLAEAHIVQPFVRLCEAARVQVRHCMGNLLQTI